MADMAGRIERFELDGERMLAACPLTANAVSINRAARAGGFRVIVAKTVTEKPKRFEYKFGDRNTLQIGGGSMLNAIGLANPGCEAAASDLRNVAGGIDVIQSIHGSSPEEYDSIIGAFDDVPCVRAYEVNVSCPNIYGRTCGGEEQEAVRRIRSLTDKPILVKISHWLAAKAPAYVRNGADYITAINTIPAAAAHPDGRAGICEGGLSGSAIKPVALHTVHCLATCGIPTVGCGGISTKYDAAEFQRAGAKATQMATSVMLNAGWGRTPGPES